MKNVTRVTLVLPCALTVIILTVHHREIPVNESRSILLFWEPWNGDGVARWSASCSRGFLSKREITYNIKCRFWRLAESKGEITRITYRDESFCERYHRITSKRERSKREKGEIITSGYKRMTRDWRDDGYSPRCIRWISPLKNRSRRRRWLIKSNPTEVVVSGVETTYNVIEKVLK